MIENTYAQRPLLRKFEYFWSRVESFVNRLTTSKYNPLYHLGTLSVYLLIVITVTGIYLTIIYRPGTEKAYATVAAISANWFGSSFAASTAMPQTVSFSWFSSTASKLCSATATGAVGGWLGFPGGSWWFPVGSLAQLAIGWSGINAPSGSQNISSTTLAAVSP